MIEFLNKQITKSGGAAKVYFTLKGKGEGQGEWVTLQAVDETGVIIAGDDGRGPLFAYPWPSIERLSWSEE